MLTVDLPVASNRLSLTRFIKRDRRDCTQCHASQDSYQSQNTAFARKPMFDGTDMKDEYWNTPMHTWDFVDKLRAATPMKVVLKGIVTAEDAELAVAPAPPRSSCRITAAARKRAAARPSTACRRS